MSDQGTMSAEFGDRMIFFSDYVYDGEAVDVYATMDAAELDEGPSERCIVSRDADGEWHLAALAAPTKEGTT